MDKCYIKHCWITLFQMQLPQENNMEGNFYFSKYIILISQSIVDTIGEIHIFQISGPVNSLDLNLFIKSLAPEE